MTSKCVNILTYLEELFIGKFLELEGGYLAIGIFVILIALFVGTRSFISEGKAWKKIVPITFFVVSGLILSHYFVTISRMDDVKTRFTQGGAIICESRMLRIRLRKKCRYCC